MTLATRVEPFVPDAMVARVARLLYPRFERELRWLGALCPTGCTALDVGTWYGPWTWRLAWIAASVVAVEPVPGLAGLLERTAPGNVRVVHAAASDHTGTAPLWTTSDGRGVRGLSSLGRRAPHTHSVPVELVTVDGLGLTRVGFVKIDVEGHEVAALRGAEATIRRDQPALLVEAETRIQDVSTIVDLVAGWGYRPWVLPGRTWVPLSEFDLAGHQSGTGAAAERGLLRRAVWPYPRYVNLVLFLPVSRSAPAAP